MDKVNTIDISPEVARLTRQHAEIQQTSFLKRMARCVVEQSIIELDPELGFLLEENASVAEVDAIARVIAVSDVVVNSRHIDVSIFDDQQPFIELPRVLLNSLYCQFGSLVVQMHSPISGKIVGYIDASTWRAALSQNDKTEFCHVPFLADGAFDLSSCLQSIMTSEVQTITQKMHLAASDYLQFLKDKSILSNEKQVHIIDACLDSALIRENLEAMSDFQPGNLRVILKQSGLWTAKTNELADRLHAKFPDVKVSDICQLIENVGADFGGQFDAPQLKSRLLKMLIPLQFRARASSTVMNVADYFLDSILDSVTTGKKAIDNVRDFVKNTVAVDVAALISEKRRSLENCAQATIDEVGSAFQELAWQPAYATHSPGTAGMDDINDALQLFALAKIAEDFETLD